MLTTIDKVKNISYCDICLKFHDANGNPPTEYVKTKRGSELFFHTACLESLKRLNNGYKN